MRIFSLWRHAIPAASLAVALHAGTALACPGFPNATENCGLTFVALGQQSLGTAAEHLSLTFDLGPFVPGGRFFDGSDLAPGIEALWVTMLNQQTLDGLRKALDDADKAYQDAHDKYWSQWREDRDRVLALERELALARQALEQQRLDDPDSENEIALNEQLIEGLSRDLRAEYKKLDYESDEWKAVDKLYKAREDARKAFVEAGGELDGVQTAATDVFPEDASPDTPPPPPPVGYEPPDIESVIPELDGIIVVPAAPR